MRRPRFTRVSEGKPLRRLLVVSKAGLIVVVCHTASKVVVMKHWCCRRDLNLRPPLYESGALPVELRQRGPRDGIRTRMDHYGFSRL